MARIQLTRRQFVQVLAGTSAAALVAACVPATAPQGGSDAPTGEAIELSFDMYNFDPWLVALDAMFKAYAEQNPGITPVVQSAPGEDFWSRQEARLAAGTPSDLSIGDPGFFGRYAHKGYYQDLESFISRDGVSLDQWFPVTVSDCRYDHTTGIVGNGTLYGMPATYVGLILYYNKDLFDAAGIGYPDDTWTRDNLHEAALALTLDSAGKTPNDADFNADDITQWGFSQNLGYGMAVLVWNNGGELISADQTECLLTEPQVVEMYEWFDALLHQEHASPTPAQLEGLPNPLQVGKVAMSMDGSWNVDYYGENLEFNWDIAPVPLGTKGLDRVTYAGTNTLHIFKDSKHVEEAWKLLQFMVGPEGMAYFAKTGTPSHIETANSDVYLTGKPDNRQEVVNLGSYAHNYYPGLKSDQWKQIYNAELEALWIGQSAAPEVLATICDKITPILQTPVDQL